MKNYIIGMLVVVIGFLASEVYKEKNTFRLTQFPIGKVEKKELSENPTLFLFLFFSKNNCISCLTEAIKTLNGIKPPFYARGVVPEDELIDEKELRQKTGAAFSLSGYGGRYRKFKPLYTPTLIGVSSSGMIVFVLPVSTMQGWQIEEFITASYSKLYPLLEDKTKDTKNTDRNTPQ